ncbi:MAG: hypothetical protein QGG09_19595 [Pirellulaceae bacterium]|nr:hypothetical protein [Pirellulaceae bacterium]HJN08886.1 hypothetical protein [Pirellulaceae bacterium]
MTRPCYNAAMPSERDEASENPYETPEQDRARRRRRPLPWWLSPLWNFFLLLLFLAAATIAVNLIGVSIP